MFRKTRIQLAAINTIILFVLLNLFGGVVYFYTYNRLYSRVDRSLLETANRFQREQSSALPHNWSLNHPADRLIVSLLWSKDGQLLIQVPREMFFAGDLIKLRPVTGTQKFRTITTADGHKYRTLDVPISATLVQFGSFRVSSVSTIQFVENVDPESEMLKDLVIIILICGLTGGIVSLVGGLFLADRALVPIKNSWDKQQQFVADASHELRTPLAIVQGQLELLFRHPDHTIEQDSGRISAVLTEVRRMAKMVSQLLILARSDSNQLELDRKEFSFDVLVRDTVAQFVPLALTKEIKVESLLDHNISFYGDPERLQQLMIILLDNALKYTPEGGSIKVIARQTKSSVNLVVEDTGIGIPEQDLPFIFDRFYRGDKARNRAGGGTGLGLAIAKWIVQAHQGTIWAESKVLEGTRINISLPLKRPRPALVS